MLPWERSGTGDSAFRRGMASSASSAMSVEFARSNGSSSVREMMSFRAALSGALLGSVSAGAKRCIKR
jgi:hypothetical protein